jgi:hypothetical protein
MAERRSLASYFTGHILTAETWRLAKIVDELVDPIQQQRQKLGRRERGCMAAAAGKRRSRERESQYFVPVGT